MSHQKERKENNCLNCGTTVHGRFCHVCGQENIDMHQSFFALVQHFIYDIFHFDGKFFDTLRYLFFKPGLVAKEYVQGKRVKYLDPIRMYLFTSAFFFLIFFSFSSIRPDIEVSSENYLTKSERLDLLMQKVEEAKKYPTDTLLQKQVNFLMDDSKRIYLQPSVTSDSSQKLQHDGKTYFVRPPDFTVSEIKSKVPGNWISRNAINIASTFERKYDGNISKGFSETVDSFLHRLPYLLFISLPFFAGILNLLYYKGKRFYYHDHAIFTLYHYIFSFILILAAVILDLLNKKTDWPVFAWAVNISLIIWPVYLLLAMKRFYEGSFLKTLGKFLLVNLLGLLSLFFLFLIFLFYTLSQI